MFDYGWHSWGLNPEDEPEYEYIVAYEDIGGHQAKSLINQQSSRSTATYGAATAVYFGNLVLNQIRIGRDRGDGVCVWRLGQ